MRKQINDRQAVARLPRRGAEPQLRPGRRTPAPLPAGPEPGDQEPGGKPRRSAAGTYHPQRQPHPEGETLLPLALRLLADWDNTEELLRQHFTLQLGKVSIAAMPSFAGNLLPLVLKTFRERHPRVNVAVHDVINEQVLEMVRNRRVELGIAFEPESLENLEFTPFYSDRFVAVVPAGSPPVRAGAGQLARTARRALHYPATPGGAPAPGRKRGRRARPLAGGVREPPTGHGRADGRPGTGCQRRADPVHPADAGTRRALPAALRAAGAATGRPAAAERAQASTAAQALSDVLLHGTDWRSLALPEDQSTE